MRNVRRTRWPAGTGSGINGQHPDQAPPSTRTVTGLRLRLSDRMADRTEGSQDAIQRRQRTYRRTLVCVWLVGAPTFMPDGTRVRASDRRGGSFARSSLVQVTPDRKQVQVAGATRGERDGTTERLGGKGRGTIESREPARLYQPDERETIVLHVVRSGGGRKTRNGSRNRDRGEEMFVVDILQTRM